MNKKRTASISLDLDNQWSYMKIHGDEGWDSYPSYIDIFVPYVLDLLDDLQLTITFFIVGKDADMPENSQWIKMIVERGHQVGNHSYYHESWLQKYSKEEIHKELTNAENAIEKVTGVKPVGFRGPGFSWSNTLLEVLGEKGYLYDCSTLPNFIGPLARMYYFWTSNLSKEEKKERSELFGSFREGFKKLKPYKINLKNGKKLLEIPVTTIPVFKIPFHLSYLLYLSGISYPLMKVYFGFALLMCRLTKTSPSFLLHPLDLIGGDQIEQLAFFPVMNIPSEKKKQLFTFVIKKLQKYYKLLPIEEYIQKTYKNPNEA